MAPQPRFDTLWSDAAIKGFRDFLSRDRHRILLIAGTAVGLLLLARGIVRLA
jgi:hypothetical protein